jgi:hypothetical protein
MDATALAIIIAVVLFFLVTVVIGGGVLYFLKEQARKDRRQHNAALPYQQQYRIPSPGNQHGSSRGSTSNSNIVFGPTNNAGRRQTTPALRNDPRIVFGNPGSQSSEQKSPIHMGPIDDSQAYCTICRKTIFVGESIITCARGHRYHLACWQSYYSETDSCPECKQHVWSKNA